MHNITSQIKRHRKPLGWILLSLFLAIWYLSSLPSPLFHKPHSKVLLSSDGELLGARIAQDGQWRFPPSDSVPHKLKEAIIAFEDNRFRFHFGIDPIAIARAARSNLKNGKIVEGASTLTMQVIRLSREGRERTFARKVSEAILATRLELTYSKNEIITLYASHAPFGGNVVGAEAAAWRYFGRTAASLSWAEAAMLAVLPNTPSLIHVAKNRNKLLAKRNHLIDKLVKRGVLDYLHAQLAKEEPLPDKPHPMPMLAPHLLERICTNPSSQSAVRATIQATVQQRCKNIAEDFAETYRVNRVENMAILVAEVSTGKVLAYIGNVSSGNSVRTNGSDVDIITAPRSSGSILKPILYAAMLNDGLILPTTLISDTPFYLRSFSPKNYNRSFDGMVPADKVLQRSLNVPTVRMLQQYGIEKFLALLKTSGFSTLSRPADHYGLTLILGGAEVTLWDAVSFYSAAAHKLQHNQPFIGLILNPADPPKNRIEVPIGDGAIWQTFEALSDLIRPEEEGGWQQYGSTRKIAWKTGTSYGNRDAWSIGITPEFVVGVWVGNASGEGRPNLTGINHAAPILFEVFNTLPRTSWFEMPEIEMVRTVICRKSGRPAKSICPEKDTVWTTETGAQCDPCPYHRELTLSKDEMYRVNSDGYDTREMKHKVFFVLPPAEEWYYRRSAPDYIPLPPLHPNCTGKENAIELIYPQRGTIVVLPRQLDGSPGAVVLHAVHRQPGAIIYWHIDNEYIGSTTAQHKITVNPGAGKHLLTLVDESGEMLKSTFIVEK